MKKLLGVTLCFIFLQTIVYADDWPMFRGDGFNSGSVEDILEPPLSVQWTFKASNKIVSSASVDDGVVYFGSRDNYLYAVDINTGKEKWKFKAEKWVDSSPAITLTKVYFSSRDGYFYCLNKEDGGLAWKKKTGGSDTSSATVDDGVVFFGVGFPNKAIYAFDAESGVELWMYEPQQVVYSSPAIKDDSLYIGASDGYVYSFKKENGSVNWKYKTAGAIDLASPALNDTTLFIAAGKFDWHVYAIDINTGKEKWKYLPEDQQVTPTYVSSVAVGKDNVFVVSGYAQQYLYSLDIASGKLKWKKPLGASTRLGFSSSPVVTEGFVYVASSQGSLKAFDSSTGTEVWNYDLNGQVLSSVAIANGSLYVGTLAGDFFKFN
jgi:outer membrane protein assembly factor BamB